MKLRIALVALALVLVGCSRETATESAGAAPELDTPAPESEASRLFAPSNEAARAATGELTVSTSLRLPDAGQAGADAQEVLTLRGANGAAVEAQITSVVSPATQVQGQTLRALLDLPVEEPQVLVYRVTNETRSQAGQGLCGAGASAFVVVWEPSAPGEAVMKILALTGGAPGAGDARACAMLDYRRS